MHASSKSDAVEDRSSYQDDSDDVRSLLSEDGRDFAATDANSREKADAQKRSPWMMVMASLGWSRPAEDLPYYALQRGGRSEHPKPRSRRCCSPCLRYFIAYVLASRGTISNDVLGFCAVSSS
jgi:hypothetical protein